MESYGEEYSLGNATSALRILALPHVGNGVNQKVSAMMDNTPSLPKHAIDIEEISSILSNPSLFQDTDSGKKAPGVKKDKGRKVDLEKKMEEMSEEYEALVERMLRGV